MTTGRRGRQRGNGEGTVYRIETAGGPRWEASFHDERGRRVKRRFTSDREAKRTLKEALGRREAGLSTMPVRHTVGQLLDAWLDYLKQQVDRGERSWNTWREYESTVRQHMRPALGHIDCRRLNVKDVDDYLGRLQLAPKTRSNHRIALRRALNVALKWGWVDRNVATHSDVIASQPREVAALSLADAQLLLDSLKGDPLYSAFVVALYSGLRAGELAGLRVEDVDLSARVANVHQQVQPVKGKGLVVKALKTRASAARLELIPEAAEALADTIGDRTEGYVWESEPGRPYWPTSLTHALTRALERAGLPHARIHDLRHYFVSFLPQLDVHPKVAQKLARHASIGTTMNLYTSVEDGLAKQALGRLHDALQDATATPTATRNDGTIRHIG